MFKVNRNKEEVKEFEGSGNKFLNKSGMYEDVTIKNLIYDEAANGGAVINFFVECQGEEQVVYGDLRVYNKGGKDNAIGQQLLNKLMVILSIDDLGEPVEEDLPIGKGKAMKTVNVFPNVEDEDISIRITNKYSVWNNNIMEKTTVSNFYDNETKATAEELLQFEEDGDESILGIKYQKDLEYADNTKYEDGLTAEQIVEWIKSKRPKGTASSKPAFKKPKGKFGGAK